MDFTFGDIQETALITLAIRASETARLNPRIRDPKAKEIIDTLGVDVSKYDPFISHAVKSGLDKLLEYGYITRMEQQARKEKGHFGSYCYVIYEDPTDNDFFIPCPPRDSEELIENSPCAGYRYTDNRCTDEPCTDNLITINTVYTNTVTISK